MIWKPEYQNVFTQTQVQGAPEWGVNDNGRMMEERGGKPFFSPLVGWLGNAQIGPIYLGWTGLVSAATFLIALFIVGFNMLAQVNWSIPEFIRQGFWLARPRKRNPAGFSQLGWLEMHEKTSRDI